MRDIKNYTDEYLKEGFENFQVEYRRKKILSIMDSIKPKRIIEIGCGLHPIFEFWHDFDLYVYFEPSETLFEKAELIKQEDARIKGYNIPFTVIDGAKDIQPDLIICSSLLHELECPEKMLADIKSLSTPSTITHINVPNANSFHRLLAKSMHIIANTTEMSGRNILLQQNRVFDIESLSKIAVDNGFVILDSGSYFIKPFTHEQMWKMLENDIIDRTVLDGLFELGESLPEIGSEIYINCRVKS